MSRRTGPTVSSFFHRPQQQGASWQKLACLTTLCGPQAIAAWRPHHGITTDAWLAKPEHIPTPTMPLLTHALEALNTASRLGRHLQATPATAATSYSEEPQTGDSAYQYVSEAGGDQLYSTAYPQLSDFLQGNEGDCYFAASLAAAIMSDRDFIKSGLVAKGKGDSGNQYQARFFYEGATEWYGLDDRFPETSFGTRLGYQQPIINGKAVAGPALWEKAWVKFSDAHPDVLNKNVKGYPAINGGHGVEALAAITNQTTAYFSPTDGQLLQKLAPVNTGNINALFAFVTANLVDTLPSYDSACDCATLSDGTKVTDNGAGQLKIQPPNGPAITLVDDHMYAVAAVFLNNQTARLFNPWGSNPGASGAVVDIRATTLAQVGSYGVIANSTKGHGHHGLSGAAIGGIVGGSVGAVAILAALGWWHQRRKKRQHAATRPAYGRDVAASAPGTDPRYRHWPRPDPQNDTRLQVAPPSLPPEPFVAFPMLETAYG